MTQTMTIEGLPLADHEDLLGKARFGIKMTPIEVAERFGLSCEKSCDELDYFDFLGIQLDATRIGFRMHQGAANPHSLVSVAWSGRDKDIPGLLAGLLGIEIAEVIKFDEDW